MLSLKIAPIEININEPISEAIIVVSALAALYLKYANMLDKINIKIIVKAVNI